MRASFRSEPHRAFLIVAALAATGVGVSAEVLREMGKLQSAVGKAIIGYGVIGDVLALGAMSGAKNPMGGRLTFTIALLTLSPEEERFCWMR